MITRLLIAAICLALGVAGGYYWGGAKLNSPNNSPANTPSSSGNTSPDRYRTGLTSKSQASSDSAAASQTIPHARTLADTATIESEFLQSAALYRLAAPLDAQGIQQLLDSAKRALTGGDYMGATTLLIGRFAELDFAAALNYTSRNGRSEKTRWLQSIFHSRARIDVDEALAEAQTLSRSQQQIAGVAMLRSTENLSAEQRRSIIDTLQLPGQVVASAQHSNAEAWAEAQNINNATQRLNAQSRVLMRWAQSEPWAAFEAAGTIESAQMRRGMQGQLLALAAADDSQRAIDWLQAQPQGQQRDRLTTMLIASLGESLPAQAQALIDGLPEDKRIQAETGLWSRKAASDPEGAAQWFASLPSSTAGALGSVRDQSTSLAMLMTLTMTAPESAERFMEALPVERRNALEPTYVQVLVQNDPAKAARRVDNITDQQQRKKASQQLVQSWTLNDPLATNRWLEQQTGEGSAELYNGFGSTWTYNNKEAAQNFAQNMRPGPERDQMFIGILNTSQLSADETQVFIDGIGDQTLRAEAERRRNALREALQRGR